MGQENSREYLNELLSIVEETNNLYGNNNLINEVVTIHQAKTKSNYWVNLEYSQKDLEEIKENLNKLISVFEIYESGIEPIKAEEMARLANNTLTNEAFFGNPTLKENYIIIFHLFEFFHELYENEYPENPHECKNSLNNAIKEYNKIVSSSPNAIKYPTMNDYKLFSENIFETITKIKGLYIETVDDNYKKNINPFNYSDSPCLLNQGNGCIDDFNNAKKENTLIAYSNFINECKEENSKYIEVAKDSIISLEEKIFMSVENETDIIFLKDKRNLCTEKGEYYNKINFLINKLEKRNPINSTPNIISCSQTDLYLHVDSAFIYAKEPKFIFVNDIEEGTIYSDIMDYYKIDYYPSQKVVFKRLLVKNLDNVINDNEVKGNKEEKYHAKKELLYKKKQNDQVKSETFVFYNLYALGLEVINYKKQPKGHTNLTESLLQETLAKREVK